MKFLLLLVTLLLSGQNLLSQKEIQPEEVIKKYIDAIGGEKKLKNIQTIYKSGTQNIYGEQHKIEEKIILQKAYSMKREFPGGQMKAIVLNGKGVNITPEGTFYMPKHQVNKFEKESFIFPELFYLNKNYNLKYYGIYELDNNTKCHEIGITFPDSTTIYKEYNIETGLLELIVDKKEQTRITDYIKIEGVMLPQKLTFNGKKCEFQKILINEKYEEADFNWNSEKELNLIGKWKAEIGENEQGQKQISFIELTADRTGKQGLGIEINGNVSVPELMVQNIVGWEIEESEKIKLHYYDSSQQKLWFKYLVIKDLTNNKIVGYVSDPEMDEMFGDELEPIELIFNKIE